MRISDWSSDVCSSDLILPQPVEAMMTAREPCPLLLLDPPYRSGLGQKALTRLVAKGWIADGAWVSLETARDENVDVAGFAVDEVRDQDRRSSVAGKGGSGRVDLGGRRVRKKKTKKPKMRE